MQERREEAPPAPPLRGWPFLVGILLVTAAVYARGLTGELVYDDRLLIARNPSIADLANLPRLFTSGYWDFLELQEAEHIGYWRPLTAIVQALLWPIAGSRPFPYHAASLVAHLGAVTAAFLIARRLGRSVWIASASALLFALHPAHVESVAWISALNDPLFGCLALFSIERFLAWREGGSRGMPLLALACFALALLAKELAAALVPLLVLLDLLRPVAPTDQGRNEPPEPAVDLPTPLRRVFSVPRTPLAAYGPFAVAFGLYMLARMLVFASPWAGFERVTTDFMVGTWRLMQLRIELFGGALEILTVPLELVVFRPFRPFLSPFDPTLVRAALFCGLYLALLVAAFLRARRLALAALLVIPAGLLPALIKVQSLGAFPLSDRFLYLPAFGFALGAALLFERAFPRRAATGLVLVLGALYAARSATRIGVWHDEETLFRTSAEQSPRSVYVQWGLGRVLLERFKATSEARYLSEAQAVFERCAKLLEESKQDPTDLMVTSRDFLQVNLGLAWCSIFAADWSAAIVMLEDLARRIEEIQEQERAARDSGVRVLPQFLDLDMVYNALGVAQFKSGAVDKAESSFRRALELQSSSSETHQNYGVMLAAQLRWPEAIREYEATLALRPGDLEVRTRLAQAYQDQGDCEKAEALARDLLDERPQSSEPPQVLGACALRRGDTGAALAWLDKALALDPRNSVAWYQKACSLLLRQEGREAVLAFRNAVEIDPQYFAAHYDCGAYLLSQGFVAEARPYLVRAYTLAAREHRKALRDSLAALELDAPALSELAAADTTRGDLEPALAWLERWLALTPGDGAVVLKKARLLRRLKRDAEALADLRLCAERAPRDFEVWSELGTYLFAQGLLEEAQAALEHALELEVPASYPAELRESSKQRVRELLDKLAHPPAPGE